MHGALEGSTEAPSKYISNNTTTQANKSGRSQFPSLFFVSVLGLLDTFEEVLCLPFSHHGRSLSRPPGPDTTSVSFL